MKRTSNSLLMSAPDPSFRFIRAAIADKCNLACMYCPKSSGMENIVPDDYRGRPLPIDTYLRNLKVLNKLGMQAISFTGGEPTLNRNLNEYLEFARSTFQRVELTTNALNVRSFISSIRDNVDLVKVSLDSVNFEVVQRVTRTRAKDELSIAKKSIALLLENGVNVGINVVVGRHNVHLLRDLFAYCRELLATSPRLHVSLLDIYFHPEIRDFYAANFIDMAEVIEYLSLADATVTDRRGCSIKWYEYNNVQIRTKDSLESTYRSDLCRSCPRKCQEGMYAVRHSVEGWVTCCPDPIREHGSLIDGTISDAGKCANLSWKLKRLQTLWFDGIGRNNIKPVRERSRDEESVTFGEKTQEEASTG